MSNSEIKIKAIRKRPTMKIKRRQPSTGTLHGFLLILFKHLGLYKRAH